MTTTSWTQSASATADLTSRFRSVPACGQSSRLVTPGLPKASPTTVLAAAAPPSWADGPRTRTVTNGRQNQKNNVSIRIPTTAPLGFASEKSPKAEAAEKPTPWTEERVVASKRPPTRSGRRGGKGPVNGSIANDWKAGLPASGRTWGEEAEGGGPTVKHGRRPMD